jgi:hypothetical protein
MEHLLTIHSLRPSVRASCSCDLWEFRRAQGGSTDEALTLAANESFERHAARMDTRFEIVGEPGAQERYDAGAKGCYPFVETNNRTGATESGTLCIRTHPADRLPRCSVCGTRAGEYLCDHPGGGGTCDRPLCAKCSVSSGRGARRVDYCPGHAA